MLLFPVPPRLAKMLVLAQGEGVFEAACELVALMHEKDILTQTQTHSDHIAVFRVSPFRI